MRLKIKSILYKAKEVITSRRWYTAGVLGLVVVIAVLAYQAPRPETPIGSLLSAAMHPSNSNSGGTTPSSSAGGGQSSSNTSTTDSSSSNSSTDRNQKTQSTADVDVLGTTPPHVSGTKILRQNNTELVLRGAMLESSFAYINQWAQGKRPSDNLNQATYDSMRSWKMNTLRTNISQWVQRQHTTEFLQQLDTIVAQATASKLYVILDFHDDCQSGSPYCDGMMRSESLAWWKQIATRYKNNNHVMYDAYNEPHYPNWDLWLNGGTVNGVAVVGFKAMIDAIRSTGSKQIIVVEPGSASGGGSQGGGWNGYTDKLTDPNLMYSKHIYAGITSAQIANPKGYEKTWDGEWGSILGKHPMYYGEWAVNPHPQDTQSNQCKGLTSTNADQITRNFLKYLQARDASWTAWDFRPYELLKSSAPDFTSTTFNVGTNWSCGEAAAKQAGMGADVKQFLLKH